MSPKILLVEDDRTLRFLMADALSLIHAEVTECPTADAALLVLERLKKHESIDLVLTDIRMPGDIDGFDLAKIIWARWPLMPVILTSGNRQVPVEQLPAHAVFIAKPWTLDQLYAVVAQQLQSSPPPDVVVVVDADGMSTQL